MHFFEFLGGKTKDVESCVEKCGQWICWKDGFIMEGKEVPNMESTAGDPEL